MKTKQEILDFYGVKIGKKYKITKTSFHYDKFYGKIFEIEDCPLSLEKIILKIDGERHSLPLLNLIGYEEYKPILDDKEREYLQKYIMDNPAFKGKVKSIQKYQSICAEKEGLSIYVNYEFIFLPKFELGSMYKGMKIDKPYRPIELGLEE